MYNLRNRSFLKEIDFTRDEVGHLLTLAQALKTAKYAGNETPRLTGKEIALIFEKSSTRTRCAFEVAAFDQGVDDIMTIPFSRTKRTRLPLYSIDFGNARLGNECIIAACS